MRELLSKPRPHHYLFAHEAVRAVCAYNPSRFFAIMASSGQAQFMDWIWGLVCKQVDDQQPNDFKVSDIKVSLARLRNHPVVIFTMPEPRAIAEAHFVVIVLTAEGPADAPPTEIPFRYFTLECGVNMDAARTERTVLCEWTKKGHVNYGDGPEAKIDELLDAIGFHLAAVEAP